MTDIEVLLVESIRRLQMEALGLDLNLTDRCDQCAAQALYRMTKLATSFDEKDLTLDMCGHHFRRHAPVMFAAKWVITASAPSENYEPVLDGVS